jgi:hypothetical protein
MFPAADGGDPYGVYVIAGLIHQHELTSRLALFLGTGNATPNLPTVMMERLYTSPTYGMWYPIDEKSLSSNLPPMVVFPEESQFYQKWKETLESKGVKVSVIGVPL